MKGQGRAVWEDAQFVFRGHGNASLMSLGTHECPCLMSPWQAQKRVPIGLYGRDLDPLRTDPPRRITETLIAGRMAIWGTKSFQTVVICVKASKGHFPSSH